MAFKKNKFKHEQDIIILRTGIIKKLKRPYTPEQAKQFRDGE